MTNLMTPVGRLVQGSLYEAQTEDALGNPLTIKNGPQAGTPRQNFYFALAVLKKGESHWNQTTWGKLIWDIGQAAFPNGQAMSPNFAWKITDGDSEIPNKVGKKPSESPGFAGCWVLRFSSSFAPAICNHDGSQRLIDPGYVNLGDFIQVAGNVAGNDSLQQPGIFLNHVAVAFVGYGERIVLGVDTKTLGFGQEPLPPGVSNVPLTKNPVGPITEENKNTVAIPAVAVAPHTAILQPGAPVINPPPRPRVMLPAANGGSYEQYRDAGWTDENLIQHGLMAP